MNWKSFVLGIGLGLAGGYITRELLSEKIEVSPEKALHNAKAAFKEVGSISGSWIHMKKEPYEKGQLHYEVYKGGISRHTGEEVKQYEFIADAKTGVILDAYPL
ncbi:PepSY domain-containing protein [Cytobacillus purgationiresistens]|uniref:Small secreted protein n=1 Tax=Cytobacillus purgationiresistens TaxID=863449 RepID=A0ABU0AP94_9BACI|nr:PepSY domain-containing protein [Cytobacillus purgationiresistens]MDQ0272223.1 putative small secreted protein [Cytobacillus purgationiresistens]